MPSGTCSTLRRGRPCVEPGQCPMPSGKHFRRCAEASPGKRQARSEGTERGRSPGRGAPKRRLLGVVAPRTVASARARSRAKARAALHDVVTASIARVTGARCAGIGRRDPWNLQSTGAQTNLRVQAFVAHALALSSARHWCADVCKCARRACVGARGRMQFSQRTALRQAAMCSR
eukprot:3765906-Alexandrium_andersonii.AAC.1